MYKGILFSSLIAFVLVAPLAFTLFAEVGRVLLAETLVQTEPWLLVLASHTPILILAFFYLQATLQPLRTYGFFYSNAYMKTIIGLGVLSAILIYAIDMYAGSLAHINSTPGVITIIGYLLAWAVVAPITEEILLRGIIQTSLREAYGEDWKIHPAILITVAVETLLHMPPLLGTTNFWEALVQSSPQIIYIIGFAGVASTLYHKTKSLTGPILIHCIGNGGELILYWIFANI